MNETGAVPVGPPAWSLLDLTASSAALAHTFIDHHLGFYGAPSSSIVDADDQVPAGTVTFAAWRIDTGLGAPVDEPRRDARHAAPLPDPPPRRWDGVLAALHSDTKNAALHAPPPPARSPQTHAVTAPSTSSVQRGLRRTTPYSPVH